MTLVFDSALPMAHAPTHGEGLRPCPLCAACGAKVVDSRPTKLNGYPSIRRRCVCPACRHKWTTYEIEAGELNEFVEQVNDFIDKIAALKMGGPRKLKVSRT